MKNVVWNSNHTMVDSRYDYKSKYLLDYYCGIQI